MEITAVKRFTQRWQLVAGLDASRNYGGVVGTPTTMDLNDPNNELNFPGGHRRAGLQYGAFRLSGSYTAPFDIDVMGSFILKSTAAHRHQSQFNITRSVFLRADARQPDRPSDERRRTAAGDVAMVDLRISRSFRFPARRITPLIEVFVLGNADTNDGNTRRVGTAYLRPKDILAPGSVGVGRGWT